MIKNVLQTEPYVSNMLQLGPQGTQCVLKVHHLYLKPRII